MNIAQILLIAVGLSLDAFAVSVVVGVSIRGSRLAEAARAGLYFGGFQALMPLLGWLAGSSLGGRLGPLEPWLPFGILSAIGLRMIYRSLRLD